MLIIKMKVSKKLSGRLTQNFNNWEPKSKTIEWKFDVLVYLNDRIVLT